MGFVEADKDSPSELRDPFAEPNNTPKAVQKRSDNYDELDEKFFLSGTLVSEKKQFCIIISPEGDSKYYVEGDYITKNKKKIIINKIIAGQIFVGKNLNISCFKNIYDYGNSVLLHISENKYIFIGTVIYQFDMEKNDCVINYFSKIGNNDVPYPIIEGKENVYFMLDLAYVKKKYTSNKTFENMYTEYYDKLQNKSKSMENIEIIHERLY